MSMPRPRAFTPLALEIIRGRLPCAAGALARAPLAAAAAGLGLANRLVTLAAALLASEVSNNQRRDDWLMGHPDLGGCQYTTSGHENFGSPTISLLGRCGLLPQSGGKAAALHKLRCAKL